MYIEEISLQGFRNYKRARAEFSPGINVITGKNAQGKTNLLEALFILCAGRSFRARSDKELMGFEEQEAKIEAKGQSGEREKRIEIIFTRGKRRQMLVNAVKQRTVETFAGNFSSVLFCPEDLELIRGGAGERRRLMDLAICQLRPRYAAILAEFNKVYEGKTRILRDWEEKPALLELLDDYDLRLARMSAELIHYRAGFVDKLSREAGRIHGEFSGGEELELKYATVKTVEDPGGPVEDIYRAVLAHQRQHREAELASRLCLTGAHKDDIEININGRAAKNFASQGQTRTAALSMKLAELEIHRGQLGEYPLLLLDDVLSELDGTRQDFVLNRIGKGQVFITCCEDGKVADRTGGRVLTVEGGNVFASGQ